MTATNLLCKIAGTTHLVKNGSFRYTGRIEEQSRCSFAVRDDAGTYHFQPFQAVEVSDSLSGSIWFTGFVGRPREQKVPGQAMIWHQIETMDNHLLLQTRTSNAQYEQQYAGAIAVQEIKPLVATGQITSNFALGQDTTQANFASGTHSGTRATANVDNGCLELAQAGAMLNITASSAADWNAGTHTNTSVVNGLLQPAATSAIKMEAQCALNDAGNLYSYVKIKEGPHALSNGSWLIYDVFLDPANPEAKLSVDLVFTDNTTLRDNYVYPDAQNMSPHPNTDLSNFTGQWYHRELWLNNFNGKTVSYVSIAVEGDKAGKYTAWFKSIKITNSSFVTELDIFSGTLSTAQQLQNRGYSSTKVSVVSTYDMAIYSVQGEGSDPWSVGDAPRWTSPAYNIDPVKILKSSYLSYTATIPAGTILTLKYSPDYPSSSVGAILGSNNAALPGLPAGLSVASRTLTLYAQFYRDPSASPLASPEVCPSISKLALTLDPSYSMAKTDIEFACVQASDWTQAGTTLTNVQNSVLLSKVLSLIQYVNSFDTSYGSVTLYSTAAESITLSNKTVALTVPTGTDARAKLNDAGQLADFTLEVDIRVDTNYSIGVVYRTTNWGDNNDSYAYSATASTTAVLLARGSNSTGAGAFTSISNPALTLASGSWYRLKAVVSGSNHKVYINDYKIIDATDGTYSAAGGFALRIYNVSGSTQTAYFDNFGVCKVLTGTWTGPSTSLSSATTYGSSIATWRDQRQDSTNGTILVESTVNGGSSWQTLTNGGAISGLTAGQSLSGISLQIRITITATTATSMPGIDNLIIRVLQQFSSSGTRISSALLLDPVGSQIGSTLVAWYEIKPSGTTVTVATSIGGSYTDVSNGGAIAGLTTTPAPTIDTFNLLTSSSYTNTARTGGAVAPWTWDTTNSRLSVSGGTNALLIYAALTIADSDLYLDLDQADNCGLIWRWTDASNYYELLVFDASSSAGSTNVLKLYKIVANVKTQLGSNTAISLTRADVHRVRAMMIGTAITIYFDGKSVLSTTDSALSGPGKAGLSNISGIGRFYNLRIQQMGESAIGKYVYTRHTLTSTIATVTPQVTSATTLVTDPNIAVGSLIDTADYRNQYKAANIGDLATRSDLYWLITAAKRFVLADRRTTPAPFVIRSNDPSLLLAGPLSVENSGEHYRNREIITGVIETVTIVETKLGDGSATSWPLQSNVLSVSIVTLNSQSVTFGAKGESGKVVYYEVGSNSIAQDSAQSVLSGTDALTITYVGQRETTVTRNNTGQFAGTISQKQFRDQSGLSIPTFTLLNQASAVTSTSSSCDDFDTSLCRVANVDINITANAGTNPTVQFFFERKTVSGAYHTLWASAVISSSSTQASTSIGPGASINESLGETCHIRWAIGGTSSPSVTFSISIMAKCDPSLAGIGIIEHITDVSGQNINVAAAEALGDSLLQRNGNVNGRSISFQYMAPTDGRPPLAEGQDLAFIIPEHNLNDVAMLITNLDITQKLTVDSGQSTQKYFYQINATESVNIGSWAKSMKEVLKG